MDEYTPIVADLVDNLNQNQLNGVPGNQPIDVISGFNLDQIESSLDNCRDPQCWESNLIFDHNVGTNTEIFQTFKYVYDVLNNSSNW